MNCSDWQARILEGGDAHAHLAACADCSEFARELAANAAALRSMEPDAEDYAAVRARVLADLKPRRRWVWLWAAATAAACAAAVWPIAVLRTPEPPRPAPMVARTAPPDAPIPRAEGGAVPLSRAGRPRPASSAATIGPRADEGVGRGRGRPPHKNLAALGATRPHKNLAALGNPARSTLKPAPPGTLAAIKMLTDDPNVVIIWLVNQGGGSL